MSPEAVAGATGMALDHGMVRDLSHDDMLAIDVQLLAGPGLSREASMIV